MGSSKSNSYLCGGNMMEKQKPIGDRMEYTDIVIIKKTHDKKDEVKTENANRDNRNPT